MYANRTRGSIHVLVLAAGVLLFILSVGMSAMIVLLGGGAELRNATDSGSLNVAKQALIGPGADLASQPEQALFFDVVEASGPSRGQIDLAVYNRVFGRTLMYGFNAHELNTAQAKSNFRNYVYPAYQALSSRLRQQLLPNGRNNNSNAGTAALQFLAPANANSLRLLGGGRTRLHCSHYATAFLQADGSGATNTYFQPGTLPPGVTVPTVPVGGRNYVTGYTTINLLGDKPVQGVVVNPKTQPHLISPRLFAAQTNAPQVLPFMPPNAFRVAGATAVQQSQLAQSACAVVGAMNLDSPASLPNRGVITIRNVGPGKREPVGNLGDKNAFTDWWNAADENKRIFTTQEADPLANVFAVGNDAKRRLQTWQQHNAEVRSQGFSTINPDTNLTGLYAFRDGQWRRPTESQMHNVITPVKGPCHSQNMGTDPDCARMAESSIHAYNFNEGRGFYGYMDYSNLEGIELQKLATLEKFTELGADQSIYREWDDCIEWEIPAQPVTGLRKLPNPRNRQSPYYIPDGGNLQITTAISPYELLEYVGTRDTDFIGLPAGFQTFNFSEIYEQVSRRVKQAFPQCKDEDIVNALKSQPLDLGETLYLVIDGNRLTLTKYPPSWYVQSTPDGKAVAYSLGYYNTLGYSVVAQGDDNIEFRYFWNLDHARPTKTIDWILWRPGSGIGNDPQTGAPRPYNLGQLEFAQTAESGGGKLCKVN